MHADMNKLSEIASGRGVRTRALRGRAGSLKGWRQRKHPLRRDVETAAYHTLNRRKGTR